MDSKATENGTRRSTSVSDSTHVTARPRHAPRSASSSADESSQDEREDRHAGGPVRHVSAASASALQPRSRSGHSVHSRHNSSDSSGSNGSPMPSLISQRSASSTSVSSAVEDENGSVEARSPASGATHIDFSDLIWNPGPWDSDGSAYSRPLDSPRPEALCIEDAATFDIRVSRWATPRIVVVGVGYVGEHLVNVFARKFDVIGFDISPQRAAQLSSKFQHNDRIKITANEALLGNGTHFLISVPTLLQPDKGVDTSFLQSALTTVARYARPGSTVIIESSVAVGMTRQFLGPIARRKSFFAGMSPERVDPGRTEPPAHSIPKVVSGLDDVIPGSLDAICRVYREVFDKVITTSKPEVAEMMKLYENCQRMVCIAFANEMADACEAHGVDPFEVCGAAATKPFGYMSMMPSLGVGGHCIPVNPYYLLANNKFPLLQAATEKMNARPAEIARRSIRRLYSRLGMPLEYESDEDGRATMMTPSEGEGSEIDSQDIDSSSDKDADDHSNDVGKNGETKTNGSPPPHSETLVAQTNGSQSPLPRVLVVGIGFKAGQAHLVNSPGIELAKSLAATSKVSVSWCDPLVTQLAFDAVPRFDEAKWSKDELEREFQLIIVAFRQHHLDFDVLKGLEGVEVEMWCP